MTTADTIDLDKGLANVSGSPEVVSELLDVFVRELPDTLYALDDAVAKKDVQTLSAVAHKIKDSLLILGDSTSAMAEQVEQEAREGSASLATVLAKDLKTRFAAVVPALQRVVKRGK